MDDGVTEAQARRAAKRLGLVARTSRWRLGTVDNKGGFPGSRAERQRDRRW
jgi:hypothetical protein